MNKHPLHIKGDSEKYFEIVKNERFKNWTKQQISEWPGLSPRQTPPSPACVM
jgi:predicted mannosyl-3-phosphoglycerate phosphatase (HAD superfamily)